VSAHTRTNKETGTVSNVPAHGRKKFTGTKKGESLSDGHRRHLNALHKKNHAKRLAANKCDQHHQIDCSYRQKSGHCALTKYAHAPEWEHREEHDAHYAGLRRKNPNFQAGIWDYDSAAAARERGIEALAEYREETRGDKDHARKARAHHRAVKAADVQAARLKKEGRRVNLDMQGQFGGASQEDAADRAEHARGFRKTMTGADGRKHPSNFNCLYNTETARCNIRKGCKPHKTADGKATQAALKTVRSQIKREASTWNQAIAQYTTEQRQQADRDEVKFDGTDLMRKASAAIRANPTKYGLPQGWKPGHKAAALKGTQSAPSARRGASPKKIPRSASARSASARKGGGSYNAYGGRNWDGFSDTSSTRSSDFTSVSDTTSFTASTDSSSMW